MEYNAKSVKTVSLVIFFVEGLTGIILFAVRYGNGIQIDPLFAYWVSGLVLLGMHKIKDDRSIIRFYMGEIIIWSLLSVVMTLVYSNPYIFVLSIFVVWMGNIPASDKRIFRTLAVFDILVAGILTFGYGKYSSLLFAGIIVTILCIYWLTLVFIYRQQKNQLIAEDLRQSYADMIELVDAKFDEAESANTAKSAFLASMSHEIRTPINAVLGLNTMIIRESGEKEIREYARDIDSAGNTLLSLVNDILDLSKVETGKMEIVPVEYQLSVLLNDVINMITLKAKNKGLGVILNVDNSLPDVLYGDDIRIKQVILNLMNNAVKYTEKGTVTLNVNGTVKGKIVRLDFSVKDTGIGIRKEDMGKLFGEYERIEEKRNRNIEGTGLGMSIASRILGLMNSQLEVHSEYGVGSEFRFLLDQNIIKDTPIGNITGRIETERMKSALDVDYTIPDANILVVDDNKTNVLVFTKLLKHLKPGIDKAYSGEEGLELIKNKKYDIIFLDHMMPGMDGIETLKRMKAIEDCINADTPVVVLTANALSGAKERYIDAGFTDYLSKPTNPNMLEKMIYDLVNPDKIKVLD